MRCASTVRCNPFTCRQGVGGKTVTFVSALTVRRNPALHWQQGSNRIATTLFAHRRRARRRLDDESTAAHGLPPARPNPERTMPTNRNGAAATTATSRRSGTSKRRACMVSPRFKNWRALKAERQVINIFAQSYDTSFAPGTSHDMPLILRAGYGPKPCAQIIDGGEISSVVIECFLLVRLGG
jgi:hypothetical protein